MPGPKCNQEPSLLRVSGCLGSASCFSEVTSPRGDLTELAPASLLRRPCQSLLRSAHLLKHRRLGHNLPVPTCWGSPSLAIRQGWVLGSRTLRAPRAASRPQLLGLCMSAVLQLGLESARSMFTRQHLCLLESAFFEKTNMQVELDSPRFPTLTIGAEPSQLVRQLSMYPRKNKRASQNHALPVLQVRPQRLASLHRQAKVF